MSSRDSKDRILLAAGTTLAMLLLVWLVAPHVDGWHRTQLAQRLSDRIEHVEDGQAIVPLRQLESLGPAAIEPLVSAAASERAAVSRPARQIISQQWASWSSSGASAGSRELTTAAIRQLAKSLSATIGQFGPPGKAWAEQLALEMIEFADTLPPREAGALLISCNRILSGVPPRGPRMRTLTTKSPQAEDGLKRSPMGQVPLDSLTRYSEESFDPDRAPTVLAFRSSGVSQPSPAESAEAILPTERPSQWQPHWEATPQALPTPAQQQAANVQKAENPPAANRLADNASNQVVDVPTPQAMEQRAAALRQLSTAALLNKLNSTGYDSSSYYEAGAVRRVLQQRGYDSVELSLLVRLNSPHVADRLRLIDELSILPATPARRLLVRLTADRSADVRLKALTALATSRAPDLTAVARELAARDEDPRVAKLAGRLLNRTSE